MDDKKEEKKDYNKDYHKIGIHRRLVLNLALNVAILYNDKDYDISEYDVQAMMALFLRKNLYNTDFAAQRERFDKSDCAIAPKGSKQPIVLYELKTYLKPHEKPYKPLAVKNFRKDFHDLYSGIIKHGKDNVRGFFILVAREKDLQAKIEFKNELELPQLKSDLTFIKAHLAGDRNSKEVEWEGQTIKIAPSRKELILGIRVMSWEVIHKNKP